jgi:hypothetical protein
MIRPTAHILDMSVTDLTDTLPIIARDITEWQSFADNTLSDATLATCQKKVEQLQDRQQKMEQRLQVLQQLV